LLVVVACRPFTTDRRRIVVKHGLSQPAMVLTSESLPDDCDERYVSVFLFMLLCLLCVNFSALILTVVVQQRLWCQ